MLVGGNGPNRTLPIAAQYAEEWNGIFLSPEEFADLDRRLDRLLDQEGCQPDEVRRSLMTRVVFGRDEAELAELLDGSDSAEFRDDGVIVGTETDVAAHLDRLDEAGADRVMLQWLALEDRDRLWALADAVV